MWAGWMSHAPGPTFSRYSPGECGGERNEQQALVRGACAQCWSRGRGNLPMKMYERGARRPASRFGSLHSIEEPQKCERAHGCSDIAHTSASVCVCVRENEIYRTVHPLSAQYLLDTSRTEQTNLRLRPRRLMSALRPADPPTLGFITAVYAISTSVTHVLISTRYLFSPVISRTIRVHPLHANRAYLVFFSSPMMMRFPTTRMPCRCKCSLGELL